ncbi:hypothetical protein [Rhizobium metallidurans]|uniref:hypothetical protein n=1 Tax=Rhizobium metallidurans TaxID=1265931 RepID=UPI001AED326F|nr:hypothetical protein [Rhizobium metallidurans]
MILLVSGCLPEEARGRWSWSGWRRRAEVLDRHVGAVAAVDEPAPTKSFIDDSARFKILNQAHMNRGGEAPPVFLLSPSEPSTGVDDDG